MSRHEGKIEFGYNAGFSHFLGPANLSSGYRKIGINSVYYGPTPPNYRNLSTISDPFFPNSLLHAL